MLDKWLSILMKASIVLGSMYIVFWLIKPSFIKRFRIKQIKEARLRTKSEIIFSTISLSMYLIPFVILALVKEKFGIFNVYLDISERGIPYFIFTIFLFMVINDTWFYWIHLAMHRFSFLKKLHHHHHLSTNTTPFTAYSFSIGEGLLNMLYYIPMIIFVPWHPLALTTYGLIGMIFNGYIHLGYDFGYKYRCKNIILKWLNSSTHHSTHHQIYDGNYSFWFTFWDKLMGTEVEDPRIATDTKS